MSGRSIAPCGRRTGAGRRQILGRRGEQLAADHLQANGFLIQQRNFRCEAGEMDLVARLAGEVVFVEVKTRRSRRCGLPEESLTPRKRAHLIAVAQTFLQQHSLEDLPWRIDVIAIELDTAGKVRRLHHIENAVFGQT